MIYSIELSAKHLDLIGAALMRLPYQEVHEIINILKRQVAQQNKDAADKKEAASALEVPPGND